MLRRYGALELHLDFKCASMMPEGQAIKARRAGKCERHFSIVRFEEPIV